MRKSNLRHKDNGHHPNSVEHKYADCGKTFNCKDNLKEHQSQMPPYFIRYHITGQTHGVVSSAHMHYMPGAVCGIESTGRAQENPYQKMQGWFQPRLQDEETQTKSCIFSLPCVFRLVHYQRIILSPQNGTYGGPKTLPTHGTPFWMGRRKERMNSLLHEMLDWWADWWRLFLPTHKKYHCNSCGHHFNQLVHWKRHQSSCANATEYEFPDGFHNMTPSMFDRLAEFNIILPVKEHLYLVHHLWFWSHNFSRHGRKTHPLS